MQLWFAPHDPRRHRLRIARPPHAPVDTLLETRSLLLHDLAHFALESHHGWEHGFYGALAAGLDPADLREGRVAPERWARLLEVEGPVVRLQGAFLRGEREHPASPLLRAAVGAWRKTRQGQALRLTWPHVEVRVSPLPCAE